MAVNAGTIYVDVRPMMAGFNQQLNTGVQTATKSMSAKMSAFGKQMLAGVGAAFAATAVVAFVGDSIQAASDLNESISKVNVVFGESAGKIRDWAEGSAESVGLSEQAALEAAGTFGNLFDSLGLAPGVTSQMSTGLVQLAADLASFNNVPVDDAILALRSGLLGEVEPMRKFGVSLSAVRVEEEAVRQGLVEQGETLDAATKAQVAYGIIMQDTANAQGDFARTSDGLANQQRILAANVENFKASLGQALIPVMLQGVQVVTALLNVLEPLLKFLPQLTVAATVFVGVFKVIPMVLSGVETGVLRLMTAFPRLGGAMAKIGDGAGSASRGISLVGGAIATLAITEAIALWQGFSINLNEVAKAAGVTRGSLAELDTRLSLTNNLTTSMSFGDFFHTLNGARDDIQAFAEGVGPLIDQLDALGLSSEGAQAHLNRMTANADTAGDLTDIEDRLAGVTEKLGTFGEDLRAQPALVDTYIQNVMRLGFTYEEAQKLADGALDEIGKSVNKAGKVVKNFGNLSDDALDELKAGFAESSHSAIEDLSNTSKQIGLTRKETVKGFNAMMARFKTFSNAMGKFSKAKWIPEEFQTWLTEQGPEAVIGFTRMTKREQQNAVNGTKNLWKNGGGDIENIINNIFKNVDTSKAVEEVGKVKKAIDEVPQTKNADIHVNYSVTGPHEVLIPKGAEANYAVTSRAMGGWVGLHGPELVWAGEKGPEFVVPNHELKAANEREGDSGGIKQGDTIRIVDSNLGLVMAGVVEKQRTADARHERMGR